METAELRPRLPPAEPTFFHGFLRYVAVLLRYKVFIIVCTAAVGLGALALCAASLYLPAGRNPLPNVYTADATILVQENPSNDLTANIISAITNANQENAAPVGFEYSALVLRMLRSRVILDQIVREFNIDGKYHLDGAPLSRARAVLLGRAKFSWAKSTGTITISYRDTDPVFARDVVNRMVVLLNGWFSEIYGTSTEKQKGLLEQKLADVRAQMDSREEQIKQLQQTYGFLTAQDLAAQLRNLSPAHADLPAVAQQYANLMQELEVQKGIYATLSHQYEMAKLSLDPVPSFQVLEMAETPDHKSGPNRTGIVAGAVVLALFGSAALSFLINGIRRVRRDPEARRILRGEA